MVKNKNHYCIILAGGMGVRLWPASRLHKPKQFLDVLGWGETLLQTTFKRYARFIACENIIVMTNEMYAGLVKEQLPELPEKNILCEPMRRNTVPSVAWAAMHISRIDRDAKMIITPADQMVSDQEALERDMLQGFEYIGNHDRLLTMGAMPTRPETSYGYIQMAEGLEHDIYKVKSFTEKPAEEFARMFVESREFLWNTGLFMSKAKVFLDAIKGLSAEFRDFFIPLEVSLRHGEPIAAIVEKAYSVCPNVPMETGLLEKLDIVDVMLCHFGWTDVGTWNQLYDVHEKQADGNVVIGAKTLMYNCNRCIVRLQEGKVAVIKDLDDYAIIADHDVLMICKKNDQQSVRHFLNDVQLMCGEEFI